MLGGGASTLAVLLQYLQGEGVGFYLSVPSLHLLRLAKIVESLMHYQEYQHLLFTPKLKTFIH